MKLNDLIRFREDLYFNGAVQSEWFYNPELSKKVSESFVFSTKDSFGAKETVNDNRIDTVTLVDNLSQKIGNSNSLPFSLAIADYGTGKSHLCVAMAQLFSGPNYMPETYNKIINNISAICRSDNPCLDSIKKNCRKNNFVIVINGMNDFNLNSEILRATLKSLDLYGVSKTKLIKSNQSIEVAYNFLNSYSEEYLELFEKYANEIGWEERGYSLIEKLNDSILSSDEAFDIINKVYNDKNGHPIRWNGDLNANVILKCLVNDYCGENREFDSVVLLFDEFGRFLEYASMVDSSKSGDYALQGIFEAAQDSNGKLQLISFIQSDIKTYAQRVDKTKNISRYIGRYDNSDKYHISSNLETVFANLIQTKDESSFNKFVSKNIDLNEQYWKNFHDCLKAWTDTKGIWDDYDLFKKIIVEGIYPIHPLATFVLTHLSDYLQNRSSLTLVNESIKQYGENEIDENNVPYVSAVQLMDGDLFSEMLSTEEDGRQSTQYCIAFSHVLKKNQDKLDEDTIKVLRANLVIRLLRLKTRFKADANYALSIASNLSLSEVMQKIKILEDEYNILAFDENANCYDFVENSVGRYDYKIFKRRILNTTHFEKAWLRTDPDIVPLAKVDEILETNFGNRHYIVSTEFKFRQVLIPIEDFNDDFIKIHLNRFKTAIDPCTVKGTIIWLYISSTTNPDAITNAQNLSQNLNGYPILVYVMNDFEGKLENDILEYKAIKSIDDKNKNQYIHFYENDLQSAESKIQQDFNELKKRRQIVHVNKLYDHKGRIIRDCDNLLEVVYNKAIPFNFDAFINSKDKLATKSVKNYIIILRLLLTTSLSEADVHNQSQEIRNRITALLNCNSIGSYRCFDDDCNLIQPQEDNVLELYKMLSDSLSYEESINISSLYNKLIQQPYGMNNYSIMLLICVVIALKRKEIRIEYQNYDYTPITWSKVVLKEDKILFDVLQNSKLKIIDIETIEKQWNDLLNEINSNENINNVEELASKLRKLKNTTDVPDEINANLILAEQHIEDGRKTKSEFVEDINELQKAINGTNERDIYAGLTALNSFDITNYEKKFMLHRYVLSEDDRFKIEAKKEDIVNKIYQVFPSYLESIRIKKVEQVDLIREKTNAVVGLLNVVQLYDLATSLKEKYNKENGNLELIKEKEEVIKDIDNFYKSVALNASSTYKYVNDQAIAYNQYLTRYKKVQHLFESKNVTLSKLANVGHQINDHKAKMDQDLKEIYVKAQNIENFNDALRCQNRIDMLIARQPKKDEVDKLQQTRKDVEIILSDMKALDARTQNRKNFEECAEKIKVNYYNAESVVLNYESANKIIDLYKGKLDAHEKRWIKEHFIDFNNNIKIVYNWKDKTRVLPLYLSEETIEKFKEYDKIADKIIKEHKVEMAIQSYKALSDEEKKEFLSLIGAYK